MQQWDDYSGQGGLSYNAINRIPQMATFKITKAYFIFILQIPHEGAETFTSCLHSPPQGLRLVGYMSVPTQWKLNGKNRYHGL